MYKKSKIIAIANQKGGVGKTTTSTNIAAALALLGKKTLIIDLDPQGNATSSFGISLEKRKFGIYQLLFNSCDINGAIQVTGIQNLDIITSDVNLSAAELELASKVRREYILSEIIANIMNYEYIVIDCPPSLGLLTINALVAANNLLVPMQCEFYSLEGLSNLLRTVDLIQKNLNKNLYISGILLTMYDKRNRLTDQVEADVRNCLGKLVFNTIIPRNVRVSEAPSHGSPVIIYDSKSMGAIKYVELTNEILNDRRFRCQLAEA